MERVAFVMHVKEGEEEEYRRRHREVWPAVLADLEQAGVRSMSIFMVGRQLILYMEVEKYAEGGPHPGGKSRVGALGGVYGAVSCRTRAGTPTIRTTPILRGCRRCSIGGWPVEGTANSVCFAQGSILCYTMVNFDAIVKNFDKD